MQHEINIIQKPSSFIRYSLKINQFLCLLLHIKSSDLSDISGGKMKLLHQIFEIVNYAFHIQIMVSKNI